jgi:hypothetical protein
MRARARRELRRLSWSCHCRRTCFGSAVADGRIFVAGGFDGEDFVHGVESYDPREPRSALPPPSPVGSSR